MSDRRWDELLNRDWAVDWDSLPDAPDWEPRAKTAQITLRLPPSLLDRVKRVASRLSLPYHALARSWIVNGLRQSEAPQPIDAIEEPQAEQLNIKLDQDLLDELKARAHEWRCPYHRLARQWIESSLLQEERNLGLDQASAKRPPLVDLMVLLLHSTNARGEDAVRGITRLQKLLFVIEQKLSTESGFYAFNFGPFNEEVNKTAEALRLAGFMEGGPTLTSTAPTFAEMMTVVAGKAGPSAREPVEHYALSSQGHNRAQRLVLSNEAYQQLAKYVASVRREYDKADLVERVYAEYPKFTERSLIRDQVARRARRRPPQ